MAEILPVDKWHRWADGTVSCWWCCANVHPAAAPVHDKWHRMLEKDGPVLSKEHDESA